MLASFLMLFAGIVVIMKKVSPRLEIEREYFELCGWEAAKQVLLPPSDGDVGVPGLEGADGCRRLRGRQLVDATSAPVMSKMRGFISLSRGLRIVAPVTGLSCFDKHLLNFPTGVTIS